MYINAKVVNRQFELVPSRKSNPDREITWSISLFCSNSYFTSIPRANSRQYRRGGDSIVLPVSIESYCGFGYFSPITSKPWDLFWGREEGAGQQLG